MPLRNPVTEFDTFAKQNSRPKRYFSSVNESAISRQYTTFRRSALPLRLVEITGMDGKTERPGQEKFIFELMLPVKRDIRRMGFILVINRAAKNWIWRKQESEIPILERGECHFPEYNF